MMRVIEIVGVRRGNKKDGRPFVQIAYTEPDQGWNGLKAGSVFLDPASIPDASKVKPGDIAEAVIERAGNFVNCYHLQVKL